MALYFVHRWSANRALKDAFSFLAVVGGLFLTVPVPNIQFTLFSLFRPPGEQQSSSAAPSMRNLSTAVGSTSSVSSISNGLMRQNSNAPGSKPGALPANLDDMKVSVVLGTLF